MLDSIALFNGISQRMEHLTLRQRVISQNVTNSDTPDYRAHRVDEPNFKKTMNRYMRGLSISNGPKQQIGMAKTSSDHMTQKLHVGRQPAGENAEAVYEVAPSENAVVLEEEMMKSAQTKANFDLMSNIYSRHQAMINRAMRNPGQ